MVTVCGYRYFTTTGAYYNPKAVHAKVVELIDRMINGIKIDYYDDADEIGESPKRN